MSDTIEVRCSTCGRAIGEITYVPGKQTLGCNYCGGITWVYIDGSNGNVNTGIEYWGKIPSSSEE